MDVLVGGSNLDSNSNIKVTLPATSDQAGFSMLAGRLSESTDPAGLITQPLRVSAQGRLTVGQPVMLLNEVFNYTAVNSGVFSQATTTQTITVAGGTLNLNASAINTLSTYSKITTSAFFPLQADFATFATWDASCSVPPLANNLVEMGFFQAATNAAPTDGAFFRFDATGTFKCVLNNNGTEFTSAALTAPTEAEMHRYKVVIENDRVLFYIDGKCVATIASPTSLGMPLYAQGVPWCARNINIASAPALANQVKIGYIFVGLQDAGGLGKSNADISAIAGRNAIQGQSGHTMGSTALNANVSATVNPAGAAMTNTTAALGTGLGGVFSALPTLAQGVDGILCSYLNPAATAAIPGKTLYIRGVKVQGGVTTVLAGGPVMYGYYLAVGHNALSLATAEGAATKAPRRLALGLETFPATAAVGTLGSQGGAYLVLDAPIAVNPGEYVAIVARNFGVVTTTGVITFLVSFNAYWE